MKSKQIGEYTVTIDGLDVSIIGDYNSNYGVIYKHNIKRFNAHPSGAQWSRPQVLGMDWDYGMVPEVKNWIYSQISKLTH